MMAVSIKLDDDLEVRLRHLATVKQRTPGGLVQDAVAQYVAREEARGSFIAEALASSSSFRDTGRHLSGEETRRWLESWGTAGEAGPPECHD